jgi:hypothetical protein
MEILIQPERRRVGWAAACRQQGFGPLRDHGQPSSITIRSSSSPTSRIAVQKLWMQNNSCRTSLLEPVLTPRLLSLGTRPAAEEPVLALRERRHCGSAEAGALWTDPVGDGRDLRCGASTRELMRRQMLCGRRRDMRRDDAATVGSDPVRGTTWCDSCTASVDMLWTAGRSPAINAVFLDSWRQGDEQSNRPFSYWLVNQSWGSTEWLGTIFLRGAMYIPYGNNYSIYWKKYLSSYWSHSWRGPIDFGVPTGANVSRFWNSTPQPSQVINLYRRVHFQNINIPKLVSQSSEQK